MRSISKIMLLALLVSPLHAEPDWVLTWSDEFNGEAGSSPSSKKWAYDIGTGDNGWGNAQLEYDTRRPENVRLNGEGMLVLESHKEDYKGMHYTSVRMKTQKKFSQAYGKFEARIKLPYGQGIWPAFWLLADSVGKVGWPECGEIDIMEYLGHWGDRVHGTVHGPGYSAAHGIGSAAYVKAGRMEDEFHVFGFEWDIFEMRWYLDGEEYFKLTPEKINGAPWVFDTPFFIILGTAVGGHWPGPPNADTVFPQQMLVDWVRVHKDRNLVIPKDYKRVGKPVPTAVPARKYAGLEVYLLPGRLQAEDFIEYKDSDITNNGGAYRDGGVDLADSTDGPGEVKVGWTKPGEWLEYDVDIAEAGKYNFSARVGCDGPGGKFHFEIAGRPVSEALDVPSTGGWGKWTTIQGSIDLPFGRTRLRLVLEEGAAGDYTTGDYNWFEFSR